MISFLPAVKIKQLYHLFLTLGWWPDVITTSPSIKPFYGIVTSLLLGSLGVWGLRVGIIWGVCVDVCLAVHGLVLQVFGLEFLGGFCMGVGWRWRYEVTYFLRGLDLYKIVVFESCRSIIPFANLSHTLNLQSINPFQELLRTSQFLQRDFVYQAAGRMHFISTVHIKPLIFFHFFAISSSYVGSPVSYI